MAKTTKRICISVPCSLLSEIESDYPGNMTSQILTTLLGYAHHAGFMTRLSAIVPEKAPPKVPKIKAPDAEIKPAPAEKKPAKRKPKAAKIEAPEAVEEFGVE